MSRKKTYTIMILMIVLSLLLFGFIYFFDLKSQISGITQGGKNNAPFFVDYIYGDFEKELKKPLDVTRVGDNIYVSDTSNKRIQVFSPEGEFKFMFGKQGTGEGDFAFPYGITSDKNNNIYVADLYNHKISIFDQNGKFLRYFKDSDPKNLPLDGAGGLRIINDKLYVTDINLGKAYVYNLDGKRLLEISKADNTLLFAPNAIVTDKNENIYISDSGNNRIVKFDKNGKYLLSINGSKSGKGNPVFINPRGLGITEDDVLLIVDNMSHRVHGYDLNGKELYNFGEYGVASGNFVLPNGLFVDTTGKVFITDAGNNRVGIYN
jgi:sugar lactone lactonase YvrE